MRRAILPMYLLLVFMVPTVLYAKEKLWTYPDPFSLDAPLSPQRAGGVDFRFFSSRYMTAIAFPLVSNVANKRGSFVSQIFLPLVVAIPEGGDQAFSVGDPRLSVRGAWKWDLHFPGGWILPLAVASGVDFNLPLSSLWGDPVSIPTQVQPGIMHATNLIGVALYPENPIGWVPGFFGVAPRAMFALGPDILFLQAEFALPVMLPIKWDHLYDLEVFLSWAAAVGTRPHEIVAVFAEFNGLVSLAADHPYQSLFQGDQAFFTLGCKVYLAGFEAGIMARIPLGNRWNVPGGEDEFVLGLYLGGAEN